MASQPELLNAFSREYLDAVDKRDEPATALEADTAEPWELRATGKRFALFRPWESFEKGDQPPGIFRFQEIGLLFRLIWPAVGRDRIFTLKTTPTPDGFAVQSTDEAIVAYLRVFNPDVTFAAHVAGYLLRSPYALALLVWLAGPNVQKQVGRILGSLVSGVSSEDADGGATTQ
jgi:hypothetical protein